MCIHLYDHINCNSIAKASKESESSAYLWKHKIQSTTKKKEKRITSADNIIWFQLFLESKQEEINLTITLQEIR